MLTAEGAELQDLDHLVVEPVALLPEQHRAAAVELDGERDQGEQGRDHHEDDGRQHAVLHRLDDVAPAGERFGLDAQHRQPRHRGDAGAGQGRAGEVGAEGHLHREALELLHPRREARLGLPREGNDDLVQRPASGDGDEIGHGAQHRQASHLTRRPPRLIVEHADDPDRAIALAPQVLDQAPPGAQAVPAPASGGSAGRAGGGH
jgi:hypothetical protein